MILLKGYGAPTKDRPGNVGDIYLDEDSGLKYECTDIIVDKQHYPFLTVLARKRNNTEYVWEKPFDIADAESFKNFYSSSSGIVTIPELDTSKGVIFSRMFYDCVDLTSIPKLDTSKGLDFSNMFSGCSSLTSIPELDTSKGLDFSRMFYNCSSLTSIPKLDTSKGLDFDSMFSYCRSLTSIPKLDTSNGLYFNSMFSGCKALTNLYLYNIRKPITIGYGTSYGTLLTVDSLVHTIKELCKVTSSTRLTMGTVNKAKIASLYCKVIDDTTEKIDMELCESTDSGAITIEEYAALKGWTIA